MPTLSPALIVSGLSTLILGLVVVIGWFSNDQSLIQLHPTFAPMQFNTALCFILLGSALLAHAWGHIKTAIALSLVVTLFAALSISQYIFGINLGIDELFIDSYIVIATSHPGRMAPNSAVSFILCSVGLALVSSPNGLRLPIAVSFALLVAASGASAVLGYIAELPSAYGWGNLTNMAAHSGGGFYIAGTGMAIYAWRLIVNHSRKASIWPVIALGLAVSLISVTLWQAVLDAERYQSAQASKQEINLIRSQLDLALELRTVNLERLADAIGRYANLEDPDLKVEARRLLNTNSLDYAAITLQQSDDSIVWISVIGNDGESAILDAHKSPALRATVQSAYELRSTQISPAIKTARRQFNNFAVVPLFANDGSPIGALTGAIDINSFVRRSTNEPRKLGYLFSVYSDANRIYGDDTRQNLSQLEVRGDFSITLGESQWQIKMYAGPAFKDIAGSKIPALVLSVGLGLALLLSYVVYLAQASVFNARDLRESQEKLRLLYKEQEKLVNKRTAAARQGEVEVRLLLDSTAEGIFGMDMDGKSTMVNPACARLLGYDNVDEIVGQHMHQLIHHTRADGEPLPIESCRIRSAYRSGVTAHSDREVFWRKDGTSVEVEYWSFPTRKDGELVGAVVTFIDISERRRATEKIEHANRELLRSNKDLEQFAYVASHDLQEPLRMVASYTQLLSRRYQGRLDADADRFIKYASDGAHRMQVLINGLLEFARLSKGELTLVEVDCNMILEDVLTDLQLRIMETDTTLSYDNLPTVVADRSQLQHVLQNLVANAIKFHGKESPRIHIVAAEHLDHWLFKVQDNGIGISGLYTEKIFEIFQRLNSRDNFAGSGIGLALCKRIVEHHGGKIWVESKEGEGSTFLFTVPK